MVKTMYEILEVVILCTIDFYTLVGNSMIILAFVLGPRAIRTFTNYFVVNLAVADLMVGCFSLPFWIAYLSDYTLLTPTVQKYFIAIDILSGTTSILNLTAISLERMYAVKFPREHFKLSSKPVLMVIAGTWSFGFLIGSSKFAVSTENSLKWYMAFIFVLVFVIPLSVILASYFVLFISARRTMSDRSLKRELRIAKTISVIIGLFVFCWMPFFIVNMLYVFCNKTLCEKLPNWLVNVTKIMHYSNSMMNFFVYARRSPKFQTQFWIILKCGYCRRKNPSTPCPRAVKSPVVWSNQAL